MTRTAILILLAQILSFVASLKLGHINLQQSVKRLSPRISAYKPSGFSAPTSISPQSPITSDKSVHDVASSQFGPTDTENPPQFTDFPVRSDTFQALITGHIGTDPKEVYLRNNSYVVNFSIGVMNHMGVPSQAKPNLLWMNAEIWGDVAKGYMLSGELKRGNVIGAIGNILANNYVDKTSGEEKKFYKIRIDKFIDPKEVENLNSAFKSLKST